MLTYQASLLDSNACLGRHSLADNFERAELSAGAWVDFKRGWIFGADQLFDQLSTGVPWQAERRRMYDRVVDVPRLLCFYSATDGLPSPFLVDAMRALNQYYQPIERERFATVGLCMYRHGTDSVAWHGDTIGRGSTDDTMVAIISLGARRRLSLRPKGGGASLRYDIGAGDLLVMGGSCQRTYEHAVLKTTRSVGPRVSVQFRAIGVR